MDKVLVNVFVPSLDEKYDMYIPMFLSVGEISELIAQMLEEVTQHRYVSSGQELICSVEQNIVLRQECTLGHYNIKNGEHLLLC